MEVTTKYVLTDTEYWTLMNALETAKERFHGHVAQLNILGQGQLAEQFEQQIEEIEALSKNLTRQYEEDLV